MDIKKAFSLTSIMISLLWLASTAAAAPAWNFDAPHGEVNFKIKHILTYVSGEFEKYGGTVKFDPDDLAGSSIDVRIAVKSVNTGEKKRDQHLLSKDFFEAKKYPEMTFKSSEITHKGGDEYVARGTMTIKDVSKEFELPFTFLGIVDNPFNDKQLIAGFISEFTLDRLEYHVGDGKYFKLGQVGKDVMVTLHFELLRNK